MVSRVNTLASLFGLKAIFTKLKSLHVISNLENGNREQGCTASSKRSAAVRPCANGKGPEMLVGTEAV